MIFVKFGMIIMPLDASILVLFSSVKWPNERVMREQHRCRSNWYLQICIIDL